MDGRHALRVESGSRDHYLASAVDGVLIATVWDAECKPLAERLVYRQPIHSIGIE